MERDSLLNLDINWGYKWDVSGQAFQDIWLDGGTAREDRLLSERRRGAAQDRGCRICVHGGENEHCQGIGAYFGRFARACSNVWIAAFGR